VIERDGAFYNQNPQAMKRVYQIDLSTGTNLEKIKNDNKFNQDKKLGLLIHGKTIEQTVLDGGWQALAAVNITPVSKKIIVDMVDKVGYPHDKMEGLWVINNHTLGILNDDDFALWSTKGKMHQKYLKDNMIDRNTLYIVDVDLNSN
jgi:hypothetical protein